MSPLLRRLCCLKHYGNGAVEIIPAIGGNNRKRENAVDYICQKLYSEGQMIRLVALVEGAWNGMRKANSSASPRL